ncbi:MAG: DUF2125 domain-containing protein [Alphaproteobacteria bacterium]|nr:DUF2125 domain-containing protein [Alphaproteobacteria bacterium]
MSSKRRIFSRRRFPLPSLLLGLAVVLGGLWFVTSAHFHKQIDAWIAAERASGNQISYDDSRKGGSPIAVTQSFRNLRWQNGKGASLHANNVTVSMRPWNWLAFDITMQHGADAMLPLPDARQPLAMHSDNVSLHVAAPFVAPKNHKDVGLSLSGKAEGLAVKTGKPLPFGDTIASAEIALRVMGSPPGFGNKDSVAAWNADSGVIEVDAFNLNWGPLDLAMNGTLALNNALQPEGAFSGQIGDREAVVKALADAKWIAKNEAGLLNATLNLLPKSSGPNGKSGETLPLAIQSGGLFLGPVRVLTLPPMTWK